MTWDEIAFELFGVACIIMLWVLYWVALP